MERFSSPTNFRSGSNNSVEVSESQWRDSTCEFRGERNSLRLEPGALSNRASVLFFGSDSTVKVGQNSRLNGKVSLGHGCTITLGRDITITAALELSTAENTTISIGSDCMFGIGCRIITHDFHPIYDAETAVRLNYSRDVFLGDHVWVGDGAVIRKGVHIGSGSVIGERAVVLHDVPDNSVVVGSPAKVVRTGVRWERDSLRTLSTLNAIEPPRPIAQPGLDMRGSITAFEYAGQTFRFFIENDSDEISKYLLNHSFYEREELELMSKFLSPASVVVDIGSNIGNHLVYFARIVGVQRLMAFEMNIAAQRIADINMLLNQVTNVRWVKSTALGATSGVGRVVWEDWNLGGARFVPDPSGDVVMVTGDAAIGDFAPTFLKIDVEGSEIDVMTGLAATIANYRPDIFLEIDQRNEAWLDDWLLANRYQVVESFKRYRANRNVFLRPIE